jgi:hypothetical protein
MSPAIISAIVSVATTLLNLFIRNQSTRARYIQNFVEWINQRASQGAQTVEVMNNLAEQQADLDRIQQDLENAGKAPENPKKG